MSIYSIAKVPAAVRTYAKSCRLANVQPEDFDAWTVKLNSVLLDEPVRYPALYCTEQITADVVKGPKWLVSERTITVNCVLPRETRLVAPRVVFREEQLHPVEVYANHIVSWVNPTPLTLCVPETSWLQLGYTPVPEGMAAQLGEINYLDYPRKAPPENVALITEEPGYSIWHLVALGLFDNAAVDEFLASLHEVAVDLLIKDLKEAMVGLQPFYVSELYRFDMPGLGIEELLAVTAYRTPFELCVMFRRPMLSGFTYTEPVVPVLQKFVEQTEAKVRELEASDA